MSALARILRGSDELLVPGAREQDLEKCSLRFPLFRVKYTVDAFAVYFCSAKAAHGIS